MKATYGTYDHDDSDVLITSMKDTSEKEGGVVARVKRVVQVKWEVRAASQAALTVKLLAAESAYHVHGKNFTLKHDAGTASAHTLIVGGTTLDTVVMEFGYPSAEGVEYATKRTCTATIEGFITFTQSLGGVGGATGDTLQYRDSVTAQGDGSPIWTFKLLPSGAAIKHTIFLNPPAYLSQSGSAESKAGFIFPVNAAPLTDLIASDSSQSKSGPFYRNNTLVYSTSWSYRFGKNTGNYTTNVPQPAS